MHDDNPSVRATFPFMAMRACGLNECVNCEGQEEEKGLNGDGLAAMRNTPETFDRGRLG